MRESVSVGGGGNGGVGVEGGDSSAEAASAQQSHFYELPRHNGRQEKTSEPAPSSFLHFL